MILFIIIISMKIQCFHNVVFPPSFNSRLYWSTICDVLIVTCDLSGIEIDSARRAQQRTGDWRIVLSSSSDSFVGRLYWNEYNTVTSYGRDTTLYLFWSYRTVHTGIHKDNWIWVHAMDIFGIGIYRYWAEWNFSIVYHPTRCRRFAI